MPGVTPLAILCHQFKYRNTSACVAGACRHQEGGGKSERVKAVSGTLKGVLRDAESSQARCWPGTTFLGRSWLWQFVQAFD